MLSEKELFKYEVIKSLVDHQGNVRRAAVKLGLSVRQIYRLIHVYKTKGKEGFIHGNRDRRPAIAKPQEVKQKVIDLYLDTYLAFDTNFTHFAKIVQEDLGIVVNPKTISIWLEEINIISPKAQRTTRKKLKKKLQKQQEKAKTAKFREDLEDKIQKLDPKNAHSRRSRSKYAGEMIQMDACEFDWFNDGRKFHIHAAIDDSTGTVTGLYMDEQETLDGYFHVLEQTLRRHGVPAMFYTDNRTVFNFKRQNSKDDSKDTMTQFQTACKDLGITIKTTSVAQSKGRIERLNETLQGRLKAEFARHGIKKAEQVNEFLDSKYIDIFNEEFALPILKGQSVFEKAPEPDRINQILAVRTLRKIDQGHCIKFQNKYYSPVNEKGKKVCFMPGTEALVLKTFDKDLLVMIGDHVYELKEVQEHETHSKRFDKEQDKPKEKAPKKPFKPAADHPWNKSYQLMKAKSQYRQNGAYY